MKGREWSRFSINIHRKRCSPRKMWWLPNWQFQAQLWFAAAQRNNFKPNNTPAEDFPKFDFTSPQIKHVSKHIKTIFLCPKQTNLKPLEWLLPQLYWKTYGMFKQNLWPETNNLHELTHFQKLVNAKKQNNNSSKKKQQHSFFYNLLKTFR